METSLIKDEGGAHYLNIRHDTLRAVIQLSITDTDEKIHVVGLLGLANGSDERGRYHFVLCKDEPNSVIIVDMKTERQMALHITNNREDIVNAIRGGIMDLIDRDSLTEIGVVTYDFVVSSLYSSLFQNGIELWGSDYKPYIDLNAYSEDNSKYTQKRVALVVDGSPALYYDSTSTLSEVKLHPGDEPQETHVFNLASDGNKGECIAFVMQCLSKATHYSSNALLEADGENIVNELIKVLTR